MRKISFNLYEVDCMKTTKIKESRDLIEIGMVMIGHLNDVDREAIQRAIVSTQGQLKSIYPEFRWSLVLIEGEDIPVTLRQEPSALLRDGSGLRDARGWDFCFMFTSSELVSRYKRYALAATSNALDVAIISTNRIDPHSSDSSIDLEPRLDFLVSRITTLCLRSLGHLSGLSSVSDDCNLMNDPSGPMALDSMKTFSADQMTEMRETLRLIADPRLEEIESSTDFSMSGFYIRSAWINRHEVLDALLQASPWEFPFRLLRLTAAALSTVMILKITAETWDLSGSLNVLRLIMVLLMTIACTTTFVTIRQGLLVSRERYLVTEQSVITNVSSVLIVLFGLLTSALVLLMISQALCFALFTDELIAHWKGVAVEQIQWLDYLKTSLVVTIMGLWIGALGATFEDQHHFRHIVFVDEEI